MSKSTLPKLCITSPWNYPLFNPECLTHFGGWEARITLIAKELAPRGNFHVNLIVGDHGQPHVEQIEGVVLYSWVGRTIWGIPAQDPAPATLAGDRSLLKKISKQLRTVILHRQRKASRAAPIGGQVGPHVISPEMISIYDEVDADIYMVPGNSQFSAEVAFYCRRRDKKYVFLAGSDFDYFPEYKLYPDQLDMYSVPHILKVYSIEHADMHIVQNERQAMLLEEGYGRSCTVIKNPIDLTPLFPRNSDPKDILWVGKSDERIKRPSIVLEIARQMPEYHFVIIMTYSMKGTHDQCVQAARQMSNVTLIERVPFSQIESYFANARLHINTSVFEGFPNTFLQAAKYGVPTVSLQVDPGGMLSQHGCGQLCDGDFMRFKDNIYASMNDDSLNARLGRQSLEYVRANHDKDVIVPRYEQALISVLADPGSPGPFTTANGRK